MATDGNVAELDEGKDGNFVAVDNNREMGT